MKPSRVSFMRPTRLLFAGVLVAAVSWAAIASARPPVGHVAQTSTIELRETKLGKIITNSSGFTLFRFTKDAKNKDNCVGISGCPEVWPPLTVTGTPTAGPGLKASKLSTTTLPNGEKQVTYFGHPLYLYVGDKGPEETGYVGALEFGGHWYALNAKGGSVK
jgi:predicted lipoprotein with Yx(FWY)xxD motif